MTSEKAIGYTNNSNNNDNNNNNSHRSSQHHCCHTLDLGNLESTTSTAMSCVRGKKPTMSSISTSSSTTPLPLLCFNTAPESLSSSSSSIINIDDTAEPQNLPSSSSAAVPVSLTPRLSFPLLTLHCDNNHNSNVVALSSPESPISVITSPTRYQPHPVHGSGRDALPLSIPGTPAHGHVDPFSMMLGHDDDDVILKNISVENQYSASKTTLSPSLSLNGKTHTSHLSSFSDHHNEILSLLASPCSSPLSFSFCEEPSAFLLPTASISTPTSSSSSSSTISSASWYDRTMDRENHQEIAYTFCSENEDNDEDNGKRILLSNTYCHRSPSNAATNQQLQSLRNLDENSVASKLSLDLPQHRGILTRRVSLSSTKGCRATQRQCVNLNQSNFNSISITSLPEELLCLEIFCFLDVRETCRILPAFNYSMTIKQLKTLNKNNDETLSWDLWQTSQKQQFRQNLNVCKTIEAEHDSLQTVTCLSSKYFMNRQSSFFDPPSTPLSRIISSRKDCPKCFNQTAHHLVLDSWWNQLSFEEDDALVYFLAQSKTLKTIRVKPGFYTCPCHHCRKVLASHTDNEQCLKGRHLLNTENPNSQKEHEEDDRSNNDHNYDNESRSTQQNSFLSQTGQRRLLLATQSRTLPSPISLEENQSYHHHRQHERHHETIARSSEDDILSPLSSSSESLLFLSSGEAPSSRLADVYEETNLLPVSIQQEISSLTSSIMQSPVTPTIEDHQSDETTRTTSALSRSSNSPPLATTTLGSTNDSLSRQRVMIFDSDALDAYTAELRILNEQQREIIALDPPLHDTQYSETRQHSDYRQLIRSMSLHNHESLVTTTLMSLTSSPVLEPHSPHHSLINACESHSNNTVSNQRRSNDITGRNYGEAEEDNPCPPSQNRPPLRRMAALSGSSLLSSDEHMDNEDDFYSITAESSHLNYTTEHPRATVQQQRYHGFVNLHHTYSPLLVRPSNSFQPSLETNDHQSCAAVAVIPSSVTPTTQPLGCDWENGLLNSENISDNTSDNVPPTHNYDERSNHHHETRFNFYNDHSINGILHCLHDTVLPRPTSFLESRSQQGTTVNNADISQAQNIQLMQLNHERSIRDQQQRCCSHNNNNNNNNQNTMHLNSTSLEISINRNHENLSSEPLFNHPHYHLDSADTDDFVPRPTNIDHTHLPTELTPCNWNMELQNHQTPTNVTQESQYEEEQKNKSLIIAKQHACARFMWILRLALLCRNTLEMVDFDGSSQHVQTMSDHVSEIPDLPVDLKTVTAKYSFPRLQKMRFGVAIDCRFIVPLLDFCDYPLLREVEILGLHLRYESLLAQFGKEPTMVFAPQQIFNNLYSTSSNMQKNPMWLPAVYNGPVDDLLQLQGQGVYVSREYRYEGSFKDGRNHGWGKMVSKCGETYEGYWKEGRRYGPGSVIQANGKQLEGDWVRDVLHGRGAMQMADGLRYEGEWSNGALDGWGVLSKNGRLLAVGQFVEGKPNGWMRCRTTYCNSNTSVLYTSGTLNENTTTSVQRESSLPPSLYLQESVENNLLNTPRPTNNKSDDLMNTKVTSAIIPFGETQAETHLTHISDDTNIYVEEEEDEVSETEELFIENTDIIDVEFESNFQLMTSDFPEYTKTTTTTVTKRTKSFYDKSKVSSIDDASLDDILDNKKHGSTKLRNLAQFSGWKDIWRYPFTTTQLHGPSLQLLRKPQRPNEILLLNPHVLHQQPGIKQHIKQHFTNLNVEAPVIPTWVEELVEQLQI